MPGPAPLSSKVSRCSHRTGCQCGMAGRLPRAGELPARTSRSRVSASMRTRLSSSVIRGEIWLRHPVEAFREVDRGSGTVESSSVARASFYPCRTSMSNTTCCMRARRTGSPRLPTRPFFEDGHPAMTRRHYGRVDLRSCCRGLVRHVGLRLQLGPASAARRQESRRPSGSATGRSAAVEPGPRSRCAAGVLRSRQNAG